MRQLLACALALLVVGIVVVSPALASREVTVTRIDDSTPTPIGPGQDNAVQACQVGNLNTAAWAISNFILPPEQYKLTFNPIRGCSACPFGYQINTVYIHLQTSSSCTIVMGVDLEDAVYPGGPTCPHPGPVDCATGLFQVSIPSAGGWIINLPIDCGCAFMDYTYLLSVYFDSVDCLDGTVPDLVTDAGPPKLCWNWNNYGTGWIDLYNQFPSWPGQLKIWADADCCEAPIGTEARSWGAIKGLFRD